MNGRIPRSKILVTEIKDDEVTKAGIKVVEKRQKQAVGEIVLIGHLNYVNSPIDVKIGNKVIFNLFNGTRFDMNGKEFILLDVNDILYCY